MAFKRLLKRVGLEEELKVGMKMVVVVVMVVSKLKRCRVEVKRLKMNLRGSWLLWMAWLGGRAWG